MAKMLAIAGSYREGGVIDQAVDVALQAVRDAGAEVDVVQLRELPMAFCTNCRICTQSAGEAPGECVQRDGMLELVARPRRSVRGRRGVSYALRSPWSERCADTKEQPS